MDRPYWGEAYHWRSRRAAQQIARAVADKPGEHFGWCDAFH